MSNLTDEELLKFNSQGLIPGPDETEEAFCKRAEYCLNLRNEILQLPFNDGSKEVPEQALHKIKTLYGFAPTWVPLFFSNYRLLPWHGGCAWIFQQSEETPISAFLQLRRPFSYKDTYLGLYSRDELLAHELCHVGRMCFEEPRFEEILAYRTSPSGFRRWVGAIAQSSWETMLFFLLLCLILIFDLFGIPLHGLKLVPLILVGLAVYRLVKRQNEYKRCLSNLQALFKNHAESILFRLTDREIVSFSHLSPEALREAIEEKKGSSLRWRVIEKAYLYEKI